MVGTRVGGDAAPRDVRPPRDEGQYMIARILMFGLAVVLLAACGGSTNQPASVEWRNLTIPLPESWYLFEEEDTRLSISNQDIGVGDDGEPREQPDGDVVAMFFTFEPATVPDDWREFVEAQDAELETDRQLELQGEVPATQLVFSYVTDGTPTREMVVVIPSRGVVLLAQPVPGPGEEDAPEVFLEYLDVFMELVESIEFGAPVLD